MPKKSGLPPNVTEYQDRHKNWHLRYRKRGQQTYHFQHKFGSKEFWEELDACRTGKAAPKIEAGAGRIKQGSLSALIAMYYGSPEFLGLKDSTRAGYKGVLERFRLVYGEGLVSDLTRSGIKDILGTMADRPSAANHLLDRLKALMRFAIDAGWRNDDPTQLVRGYRVDGEGFHTWNEEEIGKYETRHPTGSKARLAMALMLYAGQRRSDVVLMGRQHLEDGGKRIRVKQQKTGAMLSIPIHPALAAEIAQLPDGQLTFLITEYGKPHSAKGFGNWMKKRTTEAGLPECSSHGLRKAAARRLAEAGCSNQQIKAITGHKTDREVSRYTAAADQIRLSDQAMDALGSSEREQKLANFEVAVGEPTAKILKTKGAI